MTLFGAALFTASDASAKTSTRQEPSQTAPAQPGTATTTGGTFIRSTTKPNHATPNDLVGCHYVVENPTPLVSGGPLYANTWVDWCTSTMPDACHITVTIQEYGIAGPWWSDVGPGGDGGWNSCEVNGTRAGAGPYRCLNLISQHSFRAEATLAIEWNGQFDTTVADTTPESLWCE